MVAPTGHASAHAVGFALASAARSTCRTCASSAAALIPLVGRHLERAGLHAVAAAHALVGVVDHRSRARSSATLPPGIPTRRPAAGNSCTAAGCNARRGSRRRSACARRSSLPRRFSRCREAPRSAQAPSQALQPMQRVLSYRMAFDILRPSNPFYQISRQCVVNPDSIIEASDGEEELTGNLLPVGFRQRRQQVFRRTSAIGRHCARQRG